MIGLATTVGSNTAGAAEGPVGLGTAASYGVLAGSTVTNTGASVVGGDLGVSPGTAITGFPPGHVGGTQHAADAVALKAKLDLRTAYNDAAGRANGATVTSDLGGQTLVPGVYVGTTLSLTGTVTLDAKNDPSAVFVFKSASTLITASSSVVSMINGANPCNVYWQIGSSVTLGTNSTFIGTAMALTAITANTGADVTGRLLARTAAVTLDTNVITIPTCSVIPPTTTVAAPPTTTVAAPPTTTVAAPPTTTVAAPPTTTVAAPPTTTVAAPPTTVGALPPLTTGATTTAGGGASTSTGPVNPASTTGSSGFAGASGTSGSSSNTHHIVNGETIPTTPLARTGASITAPLIFGTLALGIGCLLLGLTRRAQPKRH